MELLIKHRRLVLTAGLLVVMLLIGLSVYRNFFTLYLTKTTPNISSIALNTPQISLYFNKDIKNSSFTITGTPPITLNHSIEKNRVKVNFFSTLDQEYLYTLTYHAESLDGNKLEGILQFKPRNDSRLLSERDNQIILLRQGVNKGSISEDIILSKLPHSTLSYTLNPIYDGVGTPYEQIIIKATINLSAAESRIDKSGSFEKYKKEVREYLNSLEGVNMEKYTLVYSLGGEGI